MNDPGQTQRDEAERSDSNFDNSNSISKGGCLLRAVTILMALGVIAYFVQAWIAKEVDPDLVKPVVIGNSKANGQSAEDPEAASLPPGSITASVSQKIIEESDQPFQLLLEIANRSVEEIDDKYLDYSTTLVSLVSIDGKLQEEKHVLCKIRHAQNDEPVDADKPKVPFSVYTKFLAPKANVGQEAIWIEGQNNGKIIAHPTGLLNIKRVPLDPEGALAMEGNLHPIYEIGFRNLVIKMAELAEKNLKHEECSVELKRGVEINGRVCTTFEAIHPKRDHFENHIARIYIDDELNIPIAYEAYLWPEKEGDEPPLLERYIYTELKLNPGLTDEDFDPGNEVYDFPAW